MWVGTETCISLRSQFSPVSYTHLTNAKEGCENEFALFVETESDLYLPNLTEYISFDKGEEKNIINLKQCAELLQVLKTRIKNVEIYYNPYTTKLEGEIEGAKIFNIITQEEV